MTASAGFDTLLLDVQFLGTPRCIGCYALRHRAGLALVDPGPTSTLDTLERELRGAGHSFDEVTDLLLTHIHLDHAGATGTIARRNPSVRVHVHRRGARHMVDPTRLLASATRLYGDRMDELWGEFAPVPENRVNVLEGGETLDLAGRRIEVAYTPGHAMHHVSFLDTETGAAYVGDTAGIRIEDLPYALPVTPPPDVALESWQESWDTIRAWHPTALHPTHFAPISSPDEHLAELELRTNLWADTVAADLASGGDDDACAERFAEAVGADLEQALEAEDARVCQIIGGLEDSWRGLARFWRKRERAHR